MQAAASDADAYASFRRMSSDHTLLSQSLPRFRAQMAEDSIVADSTISLTHTKELHFTSSHTTNCDPQSVCPFSKIPPEVLEKIFIFASSGNLAYTNRQFHQLSSSTLIRAMWLVEQYGTDKEDADTPTPDTLATTKRGVWKVFKPPIARKRTGKPCQCQKRASIAEGIDTVETDSWLTKMKRRTRARMCQHQEPEGIIRRDVRASSVDPAKDECYPASCGIEQVQILMTLQLIDLGADVNAGCDMALRVAARWGHLNWMTLLLALGADPNAISFFDRSIVTKWKNKGKVGGGVPGEKKFVIEKPPLSMAELQHQFLVEVGLFAPPLTVPPPLPNIQQLALLDYETSVQKFNQVPLLLQAVQANHIKLAKLLLSRNHRRHTSNNGVCMPLVSAALKEAFELDKLEMCAVIIEHGRVKPTADIVQSLVSRAGMWRLLCGLRNKLTPSIVYAVNHLPEDDFAMMSASLIRSSAEIGSVDFLKACIARGGDVNVWNGHALHASIYNGNLEVTDHLLEPSVHTSTANFGSRQKAFCIGLMMIEGFALLMFSLLLILWAIALVAYVQSITMKPDPDSHELITWTFNSTAGGNQTMWTNSNTERSPLGGSDITLGELSGMAIPSSLALLVMYRLVPLHKMCIAFWRVCKEEKRRSVEMQRRREEEARNQQQQLDLQMVTVEVVSE
ncbi:hypothetical protein HDU78_009991 [Chytriomyces hyalinus]|nr:hypothetical protein HDU78_009991 [Chytriomyces hyalinus]